MRLDYRVGMVGQRTPDLVRRFALALLILTIAACSSAPTPSARGVNGQFASIDGANVLARGPRVLDPGVTHDQLVELARANSEFALDLYRKLAAESDDNILLGPHSISTALAMVYAGARGQTATEMQRVMRLEGLEAISQRFNALDFALAARQQPGAVDLRLANQAFAEPGLPLQESYLEVLSTQFRQSVGGSRVW